MSLHLEYFVGMWKYQEVLGEHYKMLQATVQTCNIYIYILSILKCKLDKLTVMIHHKSDIIL